MDAQTGGQVIAVVGIVVLLAGIGMSDTTIEERFVCEGGAMEGEIVTEPSECDVVGEKIGEREVQNQLKGSSVVGGVLCSIIGGVLWYTNE